MGQSKGEPILARNFFLAWSKKNIVTRFIFLSSKNSKSLQQRNQSSATVVAAQAIKDISLNSGQERVASPRFNRLYRVDMGIEKNRFPTFLKLRIYGEHIVAYALWRKAIIPDGVFHYVGSGRLISAYGRSLDKRLKQLHGIRGVFGKIHNHVFILVLLRRYTFLRSAQKDKQKEWSTAIKAEPHSWLLNKI
jgi:hypothetical protein